MTNIKNNYEYYWKTRLSLSNRGIDDGLSPNEIFESVASLIKKGFRLLDVGCGNGIFMSLVKSRFYEIYGCDISESALHEVSQKGIQAVCADLNKGYIFLTEMILSTTLRPWKFKNMQWCFWSW